MSETCGVHNRGNGVCGLPAVGYEEDVFEGLRWYYCSLHILKAEETNPQPPYMYCTPVNI